MGFRNRFYFLNLGVSISAEQVISVVMSPINPAPLRPYGIMQAAQVNMGRMYPDKPLQISPHSILEEK